MNCLRCNEETSNPKFCSRSCAATHNNTLYPKRKPESVCKSCGEPNTKTRTYCMDCYRKFRASKSAELWENCTLGEMKGVGNANAGGRYPYLRTLARRKYELSSRPKECFVCGYDKHYDVAHIKDIERHTETATVAEVNALDNLLALCKNCHWELDKLGLEITMTLEDGSIYTVSKAKGKEKTTLTQKGFVRFSLTPSN